jgi:hypothetical protein
MSGLLKNNSRFSLDSNPDSPQARWLSAATLALGLTIGLALLLPAHAAVQGSTDTRLPAGVNPQATTGDSVATAPITTGPGTATTRTAPLRDGLYLYGNATSAEQHKSTYFVFEVRNRQVVGALYSPQSSYDCFYGNLNANNLNVRVFDTYEANYYPQAVNLGDYYALPQVGRRDQQLIQACRASAPAPAQLRAGTAGR